MTMRMARGRAGAATVRALVATVRALLAVRRAVVAAALASVTTQAASAQTTGVMNGVVVDEQGRTVPGMRVQAMSAVQDLATVTDRHGFYAFVSLAPERYEVVFGNGFDRQTAQRIYVHAGETTHCDLILHSRMRSLHLEGHRGNIVVPCDYVVR